MIRRFIGHKEGVSAVEFALVTPLLLALIIGSFELQRYMRLERRLSIAATTIAQMIAQRQPTDQSGLSIELDALIALMPELMGGPSAPIWDGTRFQWRQVGHQITNVVFKPTVQDCKTGCAYTAHVAQVWPSYGMQLDIPAAEMKRVCGELTSAPPSSTPSGKTLPIPFGAGSVIVVDLKIAFAPIIGSAWLGPTTFVRLGIAAPRFATPRYTFAVPSTGFMLTCPGV